VSSNTQLDDPLSDVKDYETVVHYVNTHNTAEHDANDTVACEPQPGSSTFCEATVVPGERAAF